MSYFFQYIKKNSAYSFVLKGFFVFLFSSFLNFSIFAQTEAQTEALTEGRIFSVFGVEVDITDRTAATARTKAFVEAKRIAFSLLIEKIADLDELQKLPTFKAAQIRSFVRGIEVVEERNSNVRYLATLNVSFEPSKIAEILGHYRIKFSEIGSKAYVILPILKDGNMYSLWEFNNIWRASWEKADLKNRLLSYKMVEGGFQDRLQLPVGLAIRPTEVARSRFLTLAEKYKAEDVLILIAEVDVNLSGSSRNINFKLLKAIEGNEFEGGSITSFPFESLEDHFARVTEIILTRLDLSWKTSTLTTFGQFNDLSAALFVNSVNDYIDIRRKITSMAIVENFTALSLALPEAKISLRYQGGWDQLLLSFAQSNLEITEGPDGWIIRQKKSQQ